MDHALPSPPLSTPTALTHTSHSTSKEPSASSDQTFGHVVPSSGAITPPPPAPATPARQHDDDLSLPHPAFSASTPRSRRDARHSRDASVAHSIASHASYGSHGSAGSEPQIVTAQAVLVRAASASSRVLLRRDRTSSSPGPAAGTSRRSTPEGMTGDEPYKARDDVPSYYSDPRARESATSFIIPSMPWPPPRSPASSPASSQLLSPMPSQRSRHSIGSKSVRSAKAAPALSHPYAFLAEDPVQTATASRPSSRASDRSRKDDSPRIPAEPWGRLAEHSTSALSAQTGHSGMADAATDTAKSSPLVNSAFSDKRSSAQSAHSARSAESARSAKSKRSRKRSEAAASGQDSHETFGMSGMAGAAGKRASGSSVGHRYAGRKWKVLPGLEGEEGEMELAALVGRAAVLERLLRAGKRVSSSAASARRMSTSTFRSSMRFYHSSASVGRHASTQSRSAATSHSGRTRRSEGSGKTAKTVSMRKKFARRVKHGSDSEFEALTSADEGLWADEARRPAEAGSRSTAGPSKRRSAAPPARHPFAAQPSSSVVVFDELPPRRTGPAAAAAAAADVGGSNAPALFPYARPRGPAPGPARPAHDGDVLRQSCLMPVMPALPLESEKRATWASGAGGDVEAGAGAHGQKPGVRRDRVVLVVVCGLGVVVLIGLLAGLLSRREEKQVA